VIASFNECGDERIDSCYAGECCDPNSWSDWSGSANCGEVTQTRTNDCGDSDTRVWDFGECAVEEGTGWYQDWVDRGESGLTDKYCSPLEGGNYWDCVIEECDYSETGVKLGCELTDDHVIISNEVKELIDDNKYCNATKHFECGGCEEGEVGVCDDCGWRDCVPATRIPGTPSTPEDPGEEVPIDEPEAPEDCVSTAPSKPTLVSPADGENIRNDIVGLNWAAIGAWETNCRGNLNQYRVYIDNNNPPTTQAGILSSSITSFTYPISENQQYYWRVEAFNGAYGNYSETRSFTTYDSGNVSGIVWDDVEKSCTLDPTKGLGGLRITATGPDSKETTTAADGSYTLSDLTFGSYQICSDRPAPIAINPKYCPGNIRDLDNCDILEVGGDEVLNIGFRTENPDAWFQATNGDVYANASSGAISEVIPDSPEDSFEPYMITNSDEGDKPSGFAYAKGGVDVINQSGDAVGSERWYQTANYTPISDLPGWPNTINFEAPRNVDPIPSCSQVGGALNSASAGDLIYIPNGCIGDLEDFILSGGGWRYNLSSTGTFTIYVEGSFNISGDIESVDSNSEGVIFYVAGSINIAKEVTRIDAALIAKDGITTEAAEVEIDERLVINGMLATQGGISFGRSLIRNTVPAETVIYNPMYLPYSFSSTGLANFRLTWRERQ